MENEVYSDPSWELQPGAKVKQFTEVKSDKMKIDDEWAFLSNLGTWIKEGKVWKVGELKKSPSINHLTPEEREKIFEGFLDDEEVCAESSESKEKGLETIRANFERVVNLTERRRSSRTAIAS